MSSAKEIIHIVMHKNHQKYETLGFKYILQVLTSVDDTDESQNVRMSKR